jgi:hypothetical protein
VGSQASGWSGLTLHITKIFRNVRRPRGRAADSRCCPHNIVGLCGFVRRIHKAALVRLPPRRAPIWVAASCSPCANPSFRRWLARRMDRQCSQVAFEARVASNIRFVSGTRSPNRHCLPFDVCRTPRTLQIDYLIHPRVMQPGTMECSPSSARLARSRVKARGRSIDPLGGLGDACAGPGIARVPRKHRSACALLLLPCSTSA